MKGRKLGVVELERKSVAEFQDSVKIPVVVVLDNIRSLHNIGSIFRTADAFSIEKIILCGITAKPPHREIQKTALGATESVEWEYFESCSEAISCLKTKGYSIQGVEQVEGSALLSDSQFQLPSERFALVFGNEIVGVSQDVLNLCDGYIEIPQSGTKHSLNVSVSVGILLWEFYKKLTA